MSVFVAVAEEEGFAAARRLDLSPPTVTRAVAALEDRLGVRLLNRTTRFVRPTDAGLHYLDDARRILQELASADATATGISTQPRGEIAVTAPVLFGRMFVVPAMVDYLAQYPLTRVRAVFLDRNVNLLEEGIDVGVRIGELPDSSMRARRVGSVRLVTCAARGYLDNHGRPESPEALSSHTIIGSATSELLTWQFAATRSLRVTPRLAVTTNDAAIAAARAGFGITRLLSYQVAALVSAGELELLLEEHEPPPLPVSILHREDRHASARVRAFVDLLGEQLTKNPALNRES